MASKVPVTWIPVFFFQMQGCNNFIILHGNTLMCLQFLTLQRNLSLSVVFVFCDAETSLFTMSWCCYRCFGDVKYIWNNSCLNCGCTCKWKWRMIIAVNFLASHWYRRGHGFKSRLSPDFFQASSFQLLKLENLLRWSFFTFRCFCAAL